MCSVPLKPERPNSGRDIAEHLGVRNGSVAERPHTTQRRPPQCPGNARTEGRNERRIAVMLDGPRHAGSRQGRPQWPRSSIRGFARSDGAILPELRTSLAEYSEWVSGMRRSTDGDRLESQARGLLRELEAEERGGLADGVSGWSLVEDEERIV